MVAVTVASAHHKGLYLNYDSGKQKTQAGKENYAHLWWVQYTSNMYWKADSTLRADVVSAIGDWTTKIPELTWIERPSDYDIDIKLGNCPTNPNFLGCVTSRSFSNDLWADANYMDDADVWIQDRTDWGVNGRRSVIAHELGHLYGMHEAYIDNGGGLCNNSRTSIMDTMKTDANNKVVHCDGLIGPNTTDSDDVEDFYHTGDMGSMTANSSGTVATFTWEDETWAERWYDLKFHWWDTANEEWVHFTSRSHADDVGVHVTTGSCSSSAACEDRTLTESVDRTVYNTPAATYIMCGWPKFLKYGDHGTWQCSPQVYVN